MGGYHRQVYVETVVGTLHHLSMEEGADNNNMLCRDVLVEWLLLKPCCVEMCGMLFVMYGSSVFSSVFAINERSEMGRYDVHMFMSLFGFGIMFVVPMYDG